MIKLNAIIALIAVVSTANAFVANGFSRQLAFQSKVAEDSLSMSKMSDELGIPCVDDCAITKFPKLPPSVHPGVVTGQAMIDLLNHAKEHGMLYRHQRNLMKRHLLFLTRLVACFVSFRICHSCC